MGEASIRGWLQPLLFKQLNSGKKEGQMKKSNVFKVSGYGLLVVALAGVSVFVFHGNSSRVVLSDNLKEQRRILHNGIGEHNCHCFMPLISYFTVSNVTSTSATFTWDCSSPSTYQVNYGPTASKGTLYPVAAGTTPYKLHSITVTGLRPSTLYHAGPSSICQSACNRNEGIGIGLRKEWLMDDESKSDWTFKTLPGTAVLDENIAPMPIQLSEVKVAKITAKDVTISWKTNSPATSLVEYGLTNEYGMKSGMNAEKVRDHEIQLFDLRFGTTYHFRTVSYSDDPNAVPSRSADNTFTTPAFEDRIVNKEQFFIEPNPCSQYTMISYFCYQPVKSVTIDILTLSGKLVASLESPASSRNEGWNKVRWDVTDNRGEPLTNGLYIYKMKFMTANNEAEVKGSNLMVRR